ncbi:MAG: lysophospholipase [Alphaproteobacteria bacterium MedPE-SWcel]|nr:MAG: lysophospholipase [Alphaproteobacteria bacterium MedPE-SWcel]
MDKHVHLLKLSVGSESVESLMDWQAQHAQRWEDGQPRHVTRMWPKREQEILNGGSIYWVIKGLIQCRQRILRLDEVRGEDGIRRCAIVLETKVHRTHTAPKRPFQGWRYLKPEDTPADLTEERGTEPSLPAVLSQALAEIGVI